MVNGAAMKQSRIVNNLKSFFLSNFYPPTVALLVLFGHVTGLEVYIGIILILSVAASLILCDGIKPFIAPLMTFIFLVNLKHTPGTPTWSSYYFEKANVWIIIGLSAILAVTLAYRAYKLIIPNMRKSTPMLLPLSVLCLAFLCNGFFGGVYNPINFVFGLVQVAVYFLIFYLLYFGLKGESFESMLEYIILVTVCTAIVLVGEMAYLYIAYRGIVMPEGVPIKESINLGWGIWNPVGVCLTMLIPMQIYGVMKLKRPYIYAVTGTLTYIAAILTLSRNAILAATAVLAASLIVGCFVGKRRFAFRIVLFSAIGLAAAGGIGALVLYYEKIAELVFQVLSKLSDPNGRLELWRQGIDNFLSAPLFGKGFLGFGENDIFESVSFIPDMAHNTVVQLMSSMGIFGLVAYAYYRFHSLVPFFKKLTSWKAMMLISVGAVLAMSLLDNFVFYIYTMFYPTLILAFVHRYRYEGEEDAPCSVGLDDENSSSLDVKIIN